VIPSCKIGFLVLEDLVDDGDSTLASFLIWQYQALSNFAFACERSVDQFIEMKHKGHKVQCTTRFSQSHCVYKVIDVYCAIRLTAEDEPIALRTQRH